MIWFILSFVFIFIAVVWLFARLGTEADREITRLIYQQKKGSTSEERSRGDR